MPQLKVTRRTKDNKVRLSYDVLDKAQMIASAWGLKNARAAVEAVFRRYADEYLGAIAQPQPQFAFSEPNWGMASPKPKAKPMPPSSCEALDVLDELLAL